MILNRLFGRHHRSRTPRALYETIVAQARQPEFYTHFHVPDTVEGRFELVVLHVVLALRRLRQDEGPSSALGEDLCAVMFSDFDHNLRELGVADLSVGKKVRKLAEAFYGRGKALDAALADEHPRVAATEVLARNIHFTDKAGASELADYVIRADHFLRSVGIAGILEGRIVFPAVRSCHDSEKAKSSRAMEGVAHGQ